MKDLYVFVCVFLMASACMRSTGPTGPDGEAGENGRDGSSCSVHQVDGGAVITCPDGTSAVVVAPTPTTPSPTATPAPTPVCKPGKCK